MGTRRKARELALQMLFQCDMGQQTPDQVRRSFWSERSDIETEIREFAESVFHIATERAEEIDSLIARHAQHWTLERMAAVDRNLLRTAVAEMLGLRTPRAVVINEALEIARRYSSPESLNFINGVLDSLGRSLEQSGEQRAGSPVV